MSRIRHFSANTDGRDFVVGDMHGCRALFDRLLMAASFDPSKDRVFSVGDLIDRGPDSIGCLKLLDEPWFFAVRGNHEDLMVRSTLGQRDALQCWIANGGRWALSMEADSIAEWSDRVETLPLVISVGEGAARFNVLHAEFFGTDEELDQGGFGAWAQADLMWGRTLIQGHSSEKRGVVMTAAGLKQPGLSTTYVGHSIRPAVQRVGSHVFIDTGSFLGGGKLTMIEPAAGTTYSAANSNVDGDGWLY